MKKLFVLTMIFALVLAFTSVGATANATSSDIGTSLNRDTGTGDAPIVKAKWEMLGPTFSGDPADTYTAPSGALDDNESSPGAQFYPTEQYNTYKDYTICAVVTDPDSFHNADIAGVYADIYFPQSRAFHYEEDGVTTYNSNNIPFDQINGGTNPLDYGQNGCSEQKGDELELIKLTKDEGYDLFCNNVKNYGNGNLTQFYQIPGTKNDYDYNEICSATGELEKEEAYVYCGDRNLFYEDPAGDYKVTVMAQDKAGLSSDLAENTFKYVAVQAFDVDFTSVNYGNVKLNTLQGLSGDLTFGTSDRPTVRNLGNVRLAIGVQQDDMGLGTTGGNFNVTYQARIGNEEADWMGYDPEEDYPTGNFTYLEDLLDLSEDEEMDFTILVSKWPLSDTSWIGYMTLTSQEAPFRACVPD